MASEGASSDAQMLALRSVGATFSTPDRHGQIVVLRNVSLSVGKGELVAVSGRSGSGKTTLLRVAAGLLQPTAGVVEWEGTAIAGLSRDALAARRRTFVGLVFQTGGLLEQLTAAENVALSQLPSGLDTSGRARAGEMLDRVGLVNRARHFASQLSGGERQRVAVARALFGAPRVLLVDEPTANLDRQSGDEIIELLASLQSQSQALVVASHDEHLLARADRILHLD